MKLLFELLSWLPAVASWYFGGAMAVAWREKNWNALTALFVVSLFNVYVAMVFSDIARRL